MQSIIKYKLALYVTNQYQSAFEINECIKNLVYLTKLQIG